MNSEKGQTEDILNKENDEKWDIIVSAFPSFEQWKKVNSDSPKFQTLVKDMCSDSLTVSKSKSGGRSGKDLQACWAARVDQSVKLHEKKPMILLPEAIVTFFAFAILLRDGPLSTRSCSLPTTGAYVCSNENYPGSICVQTCVNDFNDQITVRKMRVVNRARSQIMYCSPSGDWVGGPVPCLELQQSQNSIPPLGPPNFFTR